MCDNKYQKRACILNQVACYKCFTNFQEQLSFPVNDFKDFKVKIYKNRNTKFD